MSHSDSELEYEDFGARLTAVSDSDKEDHNEEGEREHDSASDTGGSDIEESLAYVQKAYYETCNELRSVRKDYLALSATIPARSRTRVLKKSSDLDLKIIKAAKKYTMFYHFWINNNLFPTTPKPDVDPHSPARWSSPESMADGTIAELYEAVPQELHEKMEIYKGFGSLFQTTIGAERSNLLRSIKDSVGLLFAPLNLSPKLYSSQSHDKASNVDLLHLLKKPESVGVEGKYERVAPVLFTDPQVMSSNTFLTSEILLNMVRLLLFGKSSLSEKKKGWPKARGERMGAQCVTEGLVAGVAIIARYPLTHNVELSHEGTQTKIPYREDYDFYLKHLFKRTAWSQEVMEYYNNGAFGNCAVSNTSKALTSTTVPAQRPRSWEDDFLDEMDQDPDVFDELPVPSAVSAPSQTAAPQLWGNSSSSTPAVTIRPLQAAGQTAGNPGGTLVNHHTSTSTDSRMSANINVSATTQVHLGIGQISLNDTTPGSSASAGRCPSASKRKVTPTPAILPQPERLTRARANDDLQLPQLDSAPPKHNLRCGTSTSHESFDFAVEPTRVAFLMLLFILHNPTHKASPFTGLTATLNPHPPVSLTFCVSSNFIAVKDALKVIGSLIDTIVDEAKARADEMSRAEITHLQAQNALLTHTLELEKIRSEGAKDELVQRVSGLLGEFVAAQDQELREVFSGVMKGNTKAEEEVVNDATTYQPAIFTTMDITTDGFGFMLSVGDLTWVPFVYSLQARYLIFKPVELGVPSTVGNLKYFTTDYFGMVGTVVLSKLLQRPHHLHGPSQPGLRPPLPTSTSFISRYYLFIGR
ncbi:hypothetical protein PAXINDRAFT_15821 [Paxillus involutus ATCC 200175]|uniref:Uncharacterized protein n=1 Tax=Paxillus involutus ATCC 200175 TaxID=664439 RepID=A0A0C9T6E8_PAXIN|nr:hypothetical protein PAXINDRAFT_15821 [Paxillus involutus ATCC 200175]